MNNIRQLYSIRHLVDAEVKENFGACPNTPYFNGLLSDMRELESAVRIEDPESWKLYQERYY